MFTTENLILRGFDDGDLEGLLALGNDPLVQRTQTYSAVAPPPSSKYKEHVKTFAEGKALWFSLVPKESGQFIGFSCINLLEAKNRDGRLSISIASDVWGKGYGTEAMRFTVNHAFKYFGLQRVSLEVTEGNARARAVYAKLGFKVEGRKRRGNWIDGHWEDIISMGVLDDEWAELYPESCHTFGESTLADSWRLH
ncbi:acyl-CoA N-acyltransferase [Suillus paluster]|uniref:acyl-CoA N-acyltransferase n=1 Tax=Suillus paluster TaxID=48578 RepID=UPI001B8739A1|nr:acyl-CoA N-acyltransferase [Suillus paluster]KAG1743334.1 acyl-CoA N-acyltransferase [Suillus paluster]